LVNKSNSGNYVISVLPLNVLDVNVASAASVNDTPIPSVENPPAINTASTAESWNNIYYPLVGTVIVKSGLKFVLSHSILAA